jgi:hypothetical protein
MREEFVLDIVMPLIQGLWAAQVHTMLVGAGIIAAAIVAHAVIHGLLVRRKADR